METKKDLILKIISAILSAIITAICLYFYYYKISRFFYLPTIKISIILLLLMFAIVVYKYLLTIMKNISNKKFVLPILMILLLICAVTGIWFIKDNVNYILRNIILMFIFIFCVVCFPIIMLGMALTGNKKFKTIKIVITVFFIIFIYAVNFSQVIEYAKDIIMNLQSYSLSEILVLRGKSSNQDISIAEGNNIDRSYLFNFAQVYEKQGYLDKYDITQILSIADSKSALTYINYKDENGTINITNKEDEKIKELEESLQGNYYKFSYEGKDTQTIINIEKYVVELPETNEENEDIVLHGIKDDSIIKNINKSVSNEYEYFMIENEVTCDAKENVSIDGLKLLLTYDNEKQNFIPVVSNLDDYSLINSYYVTNTGIRVTLNKGVKINNYSYTVRINRYNDKFELPEFQRITYVYTYEPVVSQMTDSENRLVLDFEFKNNYPKEALENIEIIFGK